MANTHMDVVITNATTKTVRQHKRYLEEKFGLVLTESNRFSRFRILPAKFSEFSKIHNQHIIHNVSVLTRPYIHGAPVAVTTKNLVNLGTYFKGTSATNFFVSVEDYADFINTYTPNNYKEFKLRHNQLQEKAKLQKIDPVFDFDVYCTSNLNVCYERYNKVIVQPIMYVRSNPSGNKGIVMHYELVDRYCKASQNFMQQKNLKIVRFIQLGSEDTELVDLLTNEKAENVKLPFKHEGMSNIFDLHHILVKNGVSVDKQDIDPGKMIKTIDLYDPIHAHYVIELMKTVCVTKNTHSLIHSVPNSNLSDYDRNSWPWALRSEENYMATIKKYNLPYIPYSEFIGKLM